MHSRSWEAVAARVIPLVFTTTVKPTMYFFASKAMSMFGRATNAERWSLVTSPVCPRYIQQASKYRTFLTSLQGTIHQYQILGNHSEMLGLIVPGGWEEFFRFIGEPYSGPLWPLKDERNFFEVLLPKLKAASEQFDMVPCPQQKQFGPSPWQPEENILPGAAEPYFLKSGTGPTYLTGGLLCRPLITTAESNGKFVIGSIEGSSHHHASGIFATGRRLKFPGTHHAFQVSEGVVEFGLGTSEPSLLHAGELVYVPSGTEICLHIRSRYAKMYAFASGQGIIELLRDAGMAHHAPIPPEQAEAVDLDNVRKLQDTIGFEICWISSCRPSDMSSQ